MTSISQESFAARLSRGKKLQQLINSFPDYMPDVPEYQPEAFKTALQAMDVTQTQHTRAHLAYAEACRQRRLLFRSDTDSMSKRITLINSYIRGKFKKDSSIYADVNALVRKIRGEKPIIVTRDADTETLSRSERSYGSQAENFANLITLMQELGTAYSPANSSIKLEKLLLLKTDIEQLNENAALKQADFKPKIAERLDGFKKLDKTSNGIKDMIKSQYGIDSSNYKLVKGL